MIPWLHISLPQLKGSDRYLNLLVKLLSIRTWTCERNDVRESVCVVYGYMWCAWECVCVSCTGACDVRESVCVVYGCMWCAWECVCRVWVHVMCVRVCVSCMGACDVRESVCVVYGCMWCVWECVCCVRVIFLKLSYIACMHGSGSSIINYTIT